VKGGAGSPDRTVDVSVAIFVRPTGGTTARVPACPRT
jgi:hypothetical protein